MTYEAHGLRIASPFPMNARRSSEHHHAPDVVVTRTVVSLPSGVERVLHYAFETSGDWVTGWRDAKGQLFVDFSGRHWFTIDADATEIGADIDLDDLDVGHALAEGWMVAAALQLRGHLVLHGSVIEHEDTVLAFVGDSGMGKTTIAAALCGDGASLIAEDLVRVDVADGRGHAHRGARALRLRPKARELADRIDAPTSRSADRLVVDLTDTPSPARARIDAILIPCPGEYDAEVAIEWMEPTEAAAELARYPRVYEWEDDAVRRTDFLQSVDLCSGTPVGHLAVPWGPPFREDLAAQIMNRLELP